MDQLELIKKHLDPTGISMTELIDRGALPSLLKLLDAYALNAKKNWEERLIGNNVHSVYTWCKDCHSKGCNMPTVNECGNCGSERTVRYYDSETLDQLF